MNWYRVEFALGVQDDDVPPTDWREFWSWLTDETRSAVIDDLVVSQLGNEYLEKTG